MPDFVYNSTALPTGKADARPLTGAASEHVTAAEWNTVMQGLLDLRSAILSGQYHGLTSAPATPVSGALGVKTRNNAGVFEVSQNGGTYVPVMTGSHVYNVLTYGADSTGATSSQAAFVAASAALEAAGGGVLLIPPGTYLVGAQTFANGTGHGYAYRPDSAIDIENCTRPVLISGYGAKLKTNPGLKFGGYHPVTGVSDGSQGNDATPDYDYAAGIGSMVVVTNNAAVIVEGLEMDGQGTLQTIGGLFGDAGRQCQHDGIRAMGNAALYVRDCRAENFLLDGFLTGYAGLVESSQERPMVLINCHARTNGRQGWSLVGGNMVRASDCSFSKTGRGVLSSAPAAGIDIEAESSIIRNVVLDNIRCEDNVGCGLLVDNGDSRHITVRRSVLWGTTSWALWTARPNVAFEDCNVFGISLIRSTYGATDTARGETSGAAAAGRDGPRFLRCRFEDRAHADRLINTTGMTDYLGEWTANGLRLEGCRIVANDSSVEHAGGTTGPRMLPWVVPPGSNEEDRAQFIDCTFEHRDDGHADQTTIGNFHHFYATKTQWLYSYATPPVSAYAVTYPATANDWVLGPECYVQTGGKLKFENWSWGDTGYLPVGERTAEGRDVYADPVIKSHSLKILRTIEGGSGKSGGFTSLRSYSAPPTTESWVVGDIVFNSAPADGEPVGWICISAGTPGTWVPMAHVGPRIEVNVLDFGADPTGATSSHTAFQAAANSLITTLNGNEGGRVVVPAGTYRFDSSCVFTNSNIEFVGQPGAIIKPCVNYSHDNGFTNLAGDERSLWAFYYWNGSGISRNVRVHGFTFDPDIANQTFSITWISGRGVQGGMFHDNQLSDLTAGIYTNPTNEAAKMFSFIGTYNSTHSKDIIITNNILSMPKFHGNSALAWLDNVDGGVVANNVCVGYDTLVRISMNSSGIAVVGNTIRGNACVDLAGGPTDAYRLHDILVENNVWTGINDAPWYTNGGWTIGVYDYADGSHIWASDIVFRNNVLKMDTGAPRVAAIAAATATAGHIYNVDISDNVVYAGAGVSDAGALADWSPIFVYFVEKHTVERNTIYDTQVASNYSMQIHHASTSESGRVVGNVMDKQLVQFTRGESVITTGNAASNLDQRVSSGTVAPTTGTWGAGAIVMNSAPTAGTALGWRCVSAGTPGTWEAFYPSALTSTGVIQDDALPGATTTSATHVDLFSGTYAQQRAGGYVLVTIQGSMYSTSSNTEAAVIATYDGVAAAPEMKVFINPVSTHIPYSATFKIAASVTAGNKTVAIQWRRVSGAGTLTTNSGDSAFITVQEVA